MIALHAIVYCALGLGDYRNKVDGPLRVVHVSGDTLFVQVLDGNQSMWKVGVTDCFVPDKAKHGGEKK
jgi:hypothetical protein